MRRSTVDTESSSGSSVDQAAAPPAVSMRAESTPPCSEPRRGSPMNSGRGVSQSTECPSSRSSTRRPRSLLNGDNVSMRRRMSDSSMYEEILPRQPGFDASVGQPDDAAGVHHHPG